MPATYRYSTPLRSKLTGLLGGIFGGLGIGGEEVVEDEARRRQFLAQHPELQSSTQAGPLVTDPNTPVPSFVKAKSGAKDFFSGFRGSDAANRYNMQSMLAYDQFVRAKALDDYTRQQNLKYLPQELKATEEFQLGVAARPNPYLTPGDVPYNLPVNPEDYVKSNAPYDPGTAEGRRLNAELARAKELANIGVISGMGVINQPGVSEQIATRVNPAAIGGRVSETRAKGQEAYERQVTSKQRTGQLLRDPGYIPRGMEIEQALSEKALTEQPSNLTPGVHLINGQVYTVTEGIDPTTGGITYKITDASGRPVSGIIPQSSIRSRATTYSGPRARPTIESQPYTGPMARPTESQDNRVTTPFTEEKGTTPPLAKPTVATRNISIKAEPENIAKAGKEVLAIVDEFLSLPDQEVDIEKMTRKLQEIKNRRRLYNEQQKRYE